MKDTSLALQPTFATPRFALAPLEPSIARKLVEYLLLDDELASKLPWMTDRTPEGARLIGEQMEAAAERGLCKMWSIRVREDEMVIGMLIARNGGNGIDLEVLVEAAHEETDLMDEVTCPVTEWLELNAESIWPAPARLH